MIKKINVGFIIVFVLFIQSTCINAVQIPQNTFHYQKKQQEIEQEGFEQQLKELLIKKTDPNLYTISLLEKVGKTQQKQLIPLLKEIAEVNNSLGFYVFYSLKQLGESNEYFLAKAMDFKKNPQLAYFSVKILSYEPTQLICNKLQELSKECEIEAGEEPTKTLDSHNPDKIHIKSAIGSVINTYAQIENIENLENLKSKLHSLLNMIGCGAGCDFPQPLIEAETDPLVIWARNKMYILSTENPSSTAEMIFQIDSLFVDKSWGEMYSKNFSVTKYRKYISKYVSDETKELLLKLEDTSSQPENNK